MTVKLALLWAPTEDWLVTYWAAASLLELREWLDQERERYWFGETEIHDFHRSPP